jgi:hypothetical protein
VFWFVFEDGLVWKVGLGVNGNWVDWGEGHTYRQACFARVFFREYAEQVSPASLCLRRTEDGVPVVEGVGVGVRRWQEGIDGAEGEEEPDGYGSGGRWRGLGVLGHSCYGNWVEWLGRWRRCLEVSIGGSTTGWC